MAEVTLIFDQVAKRRTNERRQDESLCKEQSRERMLT